MRKGIVIANWQLALHEGELEARHQVASDPVVNPNAYMYSKEHVDPYLHDAAREGNLAQVTAAVDNLHYDVNKCDKIGEIPLQKAVRCGDREAAKEANYFGVARYLLDKMVSSDIHPELLRHSLESALFLASHFASLDIVQMLLAAGAQTLFADKVLFMAAERAKKIPELLPALITGAETTPRSLTMALGIAVDLERPTTMKVLLEAGADPTGECQGICDGTRRTPLSIASARNDQELIKLLVPYVK